MSSFKYTRIYSGQDGESHFEDVEIELVDSGRGTDVSYEIPADSVSFSKFRDDYGFDLHNAPRERFIVMLTGAIEVETSDGEVRLLGPGTVLRVEDLMGVGHRSRVVGTGERLALYVQFPI